MSAPSFRELLRCPKCPPTKCVDAATAQAALTRKQRRTNAGARRVALRHERLCHCGCGARSNCRCMPPSIPVRTKMPANGRQILRPLQGGPQALHD